MEKGERGGLKNQRLKPTQTSSSKQVGQLEHEISLIREVKVVICSKIEKVEHLYLLRYWGPLRLQRLKALAGGVQLVGS